MQDIPDLQEVLQQPVQPQSIGEARIPHMHITTMQELLHWQACLTDSAHTGQPLTEVQTPVVALDPELAEFQAEIGALEAESEQANRADTPPPDQQRFQDDDGTMYVWDGNLRRFVPAGEMTPSTSYDVADMVYEAEDEKIPAMPAVTQVLNSV